MVTNDNIITATTISKNSNILEENVNLENLGPNDIGEGAEQTDDPKRIEEHIQAVLEISLKH